MSGPSEEEADDDEGEPMDIHIRRNEDGLVRVYSPEWGFSHFMWEDGNWSCDCNRYLFFQRAADEEEAEEYPCGDHRYAVKIFQRGTERVLFDDWETRR